MCFCGGKGTANISVRQGRTMENVFKTGGYIVLITNNIQIY